MNDELKLYEVCIQFNHGEVIMEVEATNEDKAYHKALDELEWDIANNAKEGYINEL